MNVLITGSSGFVGSHLCSFLDSQDHNILGHARTNHKDKANSLVCDFLRTIPEPDELKGLDIVVHLVGKVHDVEGLGTKSEYEILNHSSVLSFAKNCSKANVKKFIFFSTIKTSDLVLNNTLDDIYASTKKKGEDALIEFSKKTNMEVNIIRPALIYGEGMKGNLDALVKLIKYGLCPPFPETQNKKYLIHVQDLCKTVDSVLKETLKTEEIITVAEYKPYSTREIMQDLRYALGKKHTEFSIPFVLIKLFMNIPFGIGFRIKKLFSDDRYEILNTGFTPKTTSTLKNIFDKGR
tara:strand:- start:552 stop:1433 length:882 start_codon:yes stop_codon:yes gene_type:complete